MTIAKLKIKLKSGREIELSPEEFNELFTFFKGIKSDHCANAKKVDGEEYVNSEKYKMEE